MLALLLFFLFPPPQPSSLTGDWTTADRSVVRVLPCSSNQLCVRLIMVGVKDAPPTDMNNPDPALRKRALCGLMIGTAFTPDGSASAKNGKIYDPESGKTYAAQMQGSGDELKLRGYVGIVLLGRTETWHRTTNVQVCQ